MGRDLNDIHREDGAEAVRKIIADAQPPGGVQRTPRIETVTGRTLQEMQFQPVKWIVEPFIPEGLTLFAGKPKIGKSWFALDCGLATGFGGTALGSIQCECGDVLYLALEDNLRRLHRRIRQLLPSDAAWPERISFATRCPRFGDGGLDEIRRWADEAKAPRFVITDTFAKVRPVRSNRDNGYDTDYAALAPLQELAGERGIGALAVHHVRKMDADDPLDCVSGTTGLTGAADSVLVLTRDTQGVVLHGRGRDIDEIETALSFDKATGRWSILGDASEVRRSGERNRIIALLIEQGAPMGPSGIAKAIGLSEDGVRQMLPRMVQAGELEKRGYGKYAAL